MKTLIYRSYTSYQPLIASNPPHPVYRNVEFTSVKLGEGDEWEVADDYPTKHALIDRTGHYVTEAKGVMSGNQIGGHTINIFMFKPDEAWDEEHRAPLAWTKTVTIF